MEKDSRRVLNEILKKLSDLDYVQPADIPGIDLYMDQVLTFLEQQLGSTKRDASEKTMTKTMINNYTKNEILPPPEKKKYSRDHMLDLIIIYYLKNFLSMKDIKGILDPINDKYFGHKNEKDLYDIYEELVHLESYNAKALIKDIIKKYNMAEHAYEDAPEEDQQMLRNFAFICLLSFDVYVKKMLIEQFVDGMTPSDSDENNSEKKEGQ